MHSHERVSLWWNEKTTVPENYGRIMREYHSNAAFSFQFFGAPDKLMNLKAQKQRNKRKMN